MDNQAIQRRIAKAYEKNNEIEEKKLSVMEKELSVLEDIASILTKIGFLYENSNLMKD